MKILLLALFALGAIFGAIGPALVSAKDSIAVGAGFALVLSSIGVIVWCVKRMSIDWSRFGLAVAVLIMAGGLSACDNVPVGNIGIKVNKLGGDKGVSQETLSPGRYWIGWNEELFLFPTFTTTDTYEQKGKVNQEIVFQTQEGMTISADVGVTFSFRPDAIPTLFQKFRKGADEISDIYLRRNIQDAFNTLASATTLEAIYGSGKAKFVEGVEVKVRSEMEALGINVENIYLIGAIRVPQSVITSINAKMEATQQAQQRQNEVATAKAEADKKIEAARGEAESITLRANAQAEANRKLAQSLTPSLVQYTALQKWDGELPRITGTGAIPMINLDLK
jgi:regulator of protease activity HflC (stomatin/prohibitin superfamily)